MRHQGKGAEISILLVAFCCFTHGNCNAVNSDVAVISLIKSHGWCSGNENEIMQIDLGRVKTIAGVASRNDDSVTEFKLSYKKNVAKPWHFYEENGSEKIFRQNERSKGPSSRHWLRHKIKARYVKFHATKWPRTRAVCLHVEVYGWKNTRSDFLSGDRGRFSPVFQKLSMGSEQTKDQQKIAKDSEDSNKPKEGKSSKSLALGLSFLAVAVIAIFATIIVVKWEKHERKVRPDYLKSLRSSARGKK